MRRIWRTRAGLALLGVGGVLSACAQTADNAQIRALQSSGPVAFLCLSAPTSDLAPTEALAGLADMARPLDECGRERTDTADDYTVPHLYTLVTQPITGEVAVVDLTTLDGALLDQNPAIPGASFLPVGATPTDIAATPGGFVTFVTSAEPNFEAIYALPSAMVRGSSPRLTSWPSCRLPAAPESMLVVVDPAADNGDLRQRCDEDYAPYEPFDLTDPNVAEVCNASPTPSFCCTAPKNSATDEDVLLPHCHGDLRLDAEAAGNPGSYKLAVTLPSEGGIAIIDAQALLDQDAGAAEPCAIERWLPLQVELPAPLPPPEPTGGEACVDEPFVSEPFSPGFEALPGSMTLAQGELFIADRAAPVIHRMQLQDPCAPVEIAPLLATSSEDPARVVTTRRVAISPLTLDLKRFLYAIDEVDGSIMMFDVSDDATDTRPLSRPNPSDNPFQPPDRVRFQSPPRDIVIVQHDNDATDTNGGSLPVRCDPLPTADSNAAQYRTDDDFQSGARPELLRGVFAFAVLASGDIVAIDIDDYDAACRGPTNPSEALGCTPPFPQLEEDEVLATSGEYSCNVVAPHQARAEVPLGYVDGTLNTHPGLTAFPLLFDSEGALLKLGDTSTAIPRMRAPNDADSVIIGPDEIALQNGVATSESDEHVLTFQRRDPRAHILEQIWTVTYEGALPGFGNRFAQLTDNGDGTLTLREVTSRFCNRGVLGQAAWQGILQEEGNPSGQSAEQLADYVQIVTDSPVESDSYWDQISSCTFNSCQNAYGSSDAPAAGRDLRILEATEDTLQLEHRVTQAADAPDLKCCFPSAVAFRVRVGAQWAVVGNSVGFLHHVTTDDAGQCRLSCDEQDRLLNGRVRAIPAETEISTDDPLLFQNPFFRFAINDGDTSRDMNFQMTTQRPFRALSLSVVTNDNDVQPVAIRYLDQTGELVVSDGSLEGITLLDLNQLAIVRQYN